MDNRDFNPDNYKLEVGQIWVPDDKSDFTIKIDGLTDKEVTYVQIENGESWTEEIEGCDGFQDFLYWNNYTLKKI